MTPDLGPAFELQENRPAPVPGWTACTASYPAALTHGTVSGDIPAISEGAKRLAQGIAGLFYREDVAAHYANMEAFSEPEVFGDEWTPAPPPSAVSAQPATAAAPTQARTHTAPATAATETAK